MSRAVLWDFDGTLATRPGRWRGALAEALDALCPGHGIVPERLGALLRSGFPWHTPAVAHPELGTPGAWWARMERTLAQVVVAAGAPAAKSGDLARFARARYVDPGSYRLFDDVVPALTRLREAGYRHVILSNHVPELPDIVRGLGLAGLVAEVLTSAATAYEKPHPEAFATALRAAGAPSTAWMVGDDFAADVAGAEACGIPAILVRSEHAAAARRARDAAGAADLLLACETTGDLCP